MGQADDWVLLAYRLPRVPSTPRSAVWRKLKRLGVAECMQWRLRRQPLGVEDWRKIAGEDTVVNAVARHRSLSWL